MRSKQELIKLAEYLKGYSDAIENNHIYNASVALNELANYVCSQGFVCKGGDKCSSDHK